MTLRKWLFQNLMGKGENAGNQNAGFPQVLHMFTDKCHYFSTFYLWHVSTLDRSKILSFGQELKIIKVIFTGSFSSL